MVEIYATAMVSTQMCMLFWTGLPTQRRQTNPIVSIYLQSILILFDLY
jgi:hypothetical protein